MELHILEQLVPDVAKLIGVSPSTLLLYIMVFCTICNVVGRMIPDDKTGFLGGLRDVAKFFGVYFSNRITSGVTVNEVAKSIVTQADPKVIEAASEADALIPQVEEHIPDSPPVVPAFPGLLRKDENAPVTGGNDPVSDDGYADGLHHDSGDRK